MSRTKRTRWADLPLFAGEGELAEALLGPDRIEAWRGAVPLLEAQGFPKINPLMGGRYVPAVKAWFDRLYRLSDVHIAAPPGVEGKITWNSKHEAA